MSGILCAIRGGAASEATMQCGIAKAQEYELPLYFLHVLDLGRLLHMPRAQLDTLSQQMMEQGEFIILTAQTRAQQEGLRAHGLVRSGDIGEQIYAVCLELEAEYVIVGQPLAGDRGNEFAAETLHRLSQRIEKETQTQLIFANPETQGER